MRLKGRGVWVARGINPARVVFRAFLPTFLPAFLVLVVWLGIGSGLAEAHPVKEGSQDNRLYVLLSHGNVHSSLDGVSITIDMPSFTSTGASIHTPASIPADSARLAAFSFDVDPGVPIGTTGDALITISGTVAGNPVETLFSAPLTVAANAPAAVYVGPNLGVEDVDTDGDSVADWVEDLFGSDPFDAGSMPGAATLLVPGLSLFGLAALSGLLALAGYTTQRRIGRTRGVSQ